MASCLLTTSYLAPVHYYCKLFHYDKIIIEQHCNYIKQTYRNRCFIATANGVMPLSIPVEKGVEEKQRTKDVRIANNGNWQHLHWNAIISAYNSSPFFEYYADDFAPFFKKKQTFLFDLNESLRELISDLLGINGEKTVYSTAYSKEPDPDVADYRTVIHPKKDYKTDNLFSPVSYYQVFDLKFGFLPNLSIIDLLFNMGPESLLVLRESHETYSESGFKVNSENKL